jgi:hypothetical protein
LPASTSTCTTELFGLHPPGVGYEKCTIISNKFFLELHGARCVNVFGIVSNESSSDCLSDGVNLGGMTSALDTDADVDWTEGILASYKNRFVNLEPEDFWLDEIDWGAIDADEATAFLGMGDSSGSL